MKPLLAATLLALPFWLHAAPSAPSGGADVRAAAQDAGQSAFAVAANAPARAGTLWLPAKAAGGITPVATVAADNTRQGGNAGGGADYSFMTVATRVDTPARFGSANSEPAKARALAPAVLTVAAAPSQGAVRSGAASTDLSATSAPSPASESELLALVLAGLGAMAFMARRRRRN